MELTVEFGFSAAHHLAQAAGRCRHMHGHDYNLFVTIDGPVRDDDGMVMDFHEIDDIVQQQVIGQLDGTDLNALLSCPTAERIAEWIFAQLDPRLPGLTKLVLYETPRYSVTLRKRP